jgi:hypothetical protein
MSHQLVGTGLRDRTIFRVKIYAFGMYVDPAGARAALRGFAGQPASVLERNERFYRRVLDLDFAITLRLVMLRNVGGDDVASAFEEALRTRLARVERETRDRSGLLALETFRRFFDVQEVRRGTEIVFSCNARGQFASALGGVRRPVLESKPLCRALFDVYLGERPISESGKKSVIAGFPALLSRQNASRVSVGPLPEVAHRGGRDGGERLCGDACGTAHMGLSQ